jgi:hypothetical protein
MEKKLTAEQIALIDETLVLNELSYEDIKYEVLDHVACEIETIMASDEIGFDVALKIVFEKWKTQLNPATYGLTLGFNFSGPKIAMSKMSKIAINEFKWSFIMSLIIMIFIKLMTYSFGITDGFVDVLRMVIKISLFGSFGLYFMGKLKLYKSKCKTTFSELYSRRFYLIIVYTIAFAFDVFKILPNYTPPEEIIVSLIFILLPLFYTLSALTLLIKHYKLKEKYQIN